MIPKRKVFGIGNRRLLSCLLFWLARRTGRLQNIGALRLNSIGIRL